MEGTFKNWVPGKLFGFIKPDDGQADIFVHKSSVPTGEVLTPGTKVSYEIEMSDKGRPKAKDIVVLTAGPPIQRSSGRVKFWNEHGWGFIGRSGESDVYVNDKDIHPSSFLCEGDVVDFSVMKGERGFQARDVVVTGWTKPSDPLSAFMDTGPPGWLDRLAKLAEEEPWDYKHAKASESLPVLRSYLRYTFMRLTEMESGIGVSREGSHATFNTGLVTPNQEEIYCLCRKNPVPGRHPWKLVGFKKSSERDMIDHFGSARPPLAHYFDDPSVLLYDRRLELYVAIDHVMENIDRFPEAFQKNEFMARQLLAGAEATMAKRVSRNYKTAIPQFFRDRGGAGSVQLLMPICLENPGRADLALVVAKNEAGTAYRGETVLTLDMAYNNARLLCRPDVEWLQP